MPSGGLRWLPRMTVPRTQYAASAGTNGHLFAVEEPRQVSLEDFSSEGDNEKHPLSMCIMLAILCCVPLVVAKIAKQTQERILTAIRRT